MKPFTWQVYLAWRHRHPNEAHVDKTETYQKSYGLWSTRMGCDIHMVLERKHPTHGWVGVRDFSSFPTIALDWSVENAKRIPFLWWRIRERNYRLFAQLAGVRGDGPEPRGLPKDVSALAAMTSESWGEDGHSHSWGLLDEIGGAFLAHYDTKEVLSTERTARILELFGEEPNTAAKLDEYRLVYWFDN